MAFTNNMVSAKNTLWADLQTFLVEIIQHYVSD